MIKKIRISVVLASYNGAAFISEQLHSLLTELGNDDEIIVADDASSDNTIEVVNRFVDPRVKVFRFDKRVGYQKNFERAVNVSRGRFIFFSDQDDFCLPERVSASLNALKDCDCVCGDAILVDGAMQPLAPSFFGLRGSRSFTALGLFLRPSVIGATMACRRSFVAGALPFPEGVSHDHWLSVLAASQGKLTVVHMPFILYRRHAGAASPTGMTVRRRALPVIVAERWHLLVALWRRRHSRTFSESKA